MAVVSVVALEVAVALVEEVEGVSVVAVDPVAG
jgi:hypothetical protein